MNTPEIINTPTPCPFQGWAGYPLPTDKETLWEEFERLSSPPLHIMKTRNALDFPLTLEDLYHHPDFLPFGSSSDDWINDQDRMERCHDAAEDGCDGSTHREIMGDWREFLDRLESEAKGKTHWHDRVEAEIERRAQSIREEIDACEAWHVEHGSIDEQVG